MNLKKFFSFLLFFLSILTPVLTVWATTDSPVLLESRVQNQSILLYTRNMTGTSVQARVGSESITGVTVDGQDGSLPVTTWLLLDNSVSIQSADRERAKELLADLVSARTANEVFTLCTFADHLNPILWETQDYSDLKRAIDGIQHYNQETYLTDCLNELLDLETSRMDARYVRIVIISDGVDNNPGGITRDELEKRLTTFNFPIYSVGCNGNAQELKEMYAISRQTGANYWAFSEAENYDITHAMSNEEIPARITIPLPDSLCDGTTKGVQLTLSDGAVLQTQIDMPFGPISLVSPTNPGSAVSPTPTPFRTPPPTEEPKAEHTAADWMREHWLLIVILALVIAALAVVGFILLQRKKQRPGSPNMAESTFAVTAPQDAAPPHGSIFVGRGKKDNEITIDNPLISKTHCAIFVDGDTIKVFDLNSMNGTSVDGVKLEKGGCKEAKSGSSLTLADTDFELEICSVTPDSPSYGDTVFMALPDDPLMKTPERRVLRLTDLGRRDLCYEALLPDRSPGTVWTDGTMYMGNRK